MLCELWTTADKEEIKDSLKLPSANSFIRNTLLEITMKHKKRWEND